MKCQMCQVAEALEDMTVCQECYDLFLTGENAFVDSSEKSIRVISYDAAAPCPTIK